jgi:hypothetical protein
MIHEWKIEAPEFITSLMREAPEFITASMREALEFITSPMGETLEFINSPVGEVPEFITSPMGRGRIGPAMRRIVGASRYGLSIDCNPSPQPSPYGRGSVISAVAAPSPAFKRIKL